MKRLAALCMTVACWSVNAQVACTMPNGRTITLQLSHTCPVGTVSAKSLDGQPIQIAPPSPTSAAPQPQPIKAAPGTPPNKATSPAPNGTHVVSRNSQPGCVSREVYEQLTKIAVQGDSEAFTRALGGSIITGQCLIFKRGDEVFLDDTAIFSGLVRLRPRGQIRAYWTAAEAISTK